MENMQELVKGARFQFKEYEARKSLKVFGWSFASALVTLAISLLAAVEVPTAYLWMVPIVNMMLYAIKELVTDNLDPQ